MQSLLQRDLRQDKPFGSLEEVVFLNLLRTADDLLQGEVAVLRTADLSFAQYNVLRVLRGAGKDGLPCSAIAERLVNRDPDVTRLLDRLEQRRLVERARDSADRRVVLATITRDGLQLLKDLDGPVSAVHRDQLAHLSRRQLEQLSGLLEAARTRGG
ncbi:MAG: MarR family transcriptional regulator [Gemmatimonadaceae bacterium]|nr:MarR family transcriptional regulator [Gemmatimonadaceae bacterium]